MDLTNTWTKNDLTPPGQNTVSHFKTYNVFLLYLILLIIFSTIVLALGVSNRSHSILLLSTIIYWAVATIPILFAHDNWMNPLIFQMIFEIPKVLSLAIRATGQIYISRKWVMDVPYDDVVNVYIKCVAITCIGLIIEYLIMWRITIKAKGLNLKLTKNMKPLYLTLITSIAFFLLMQGLGGISNVWDNYQSRLTEFGENTNLYYRYMIYWGIIPCFYFYLIDFKFLYYATLILEVLFFFLLGERGGMIISIGISFLIVNQLKENKTIKLSRIVFYIFIFILVYEGIGELRDRREFESYESFQEESVTDVVDTLGDIKHFVISSELIYNIDNKYIQHTWGAPMLNILYAGFPRKLFPWKPTYIAESALVGSLILDRDENVFGLPPGVFAYGYLNFGWAGVILFAVICGLFMKWLYTVLILLPREKSEVLPRGNILLYMLSVNYAYIIISTEAQTKLIMNLIGFILFYMMVKSKGETPDE